MEFKEQLPVWKAEGVAPPETIQNEGWKVGDRPPADIFNWLHNRTYTSLEEIREKMNWLADNSGKVETVNNIKPDSNKNIKLTGTNIPYKDGVTENIATKISKMDTEIDTVKQSGVKSNKRISDKLNSLEIPASDTDSISTNIGKFESIPNQGKLDKTILLDDYKNLEGKQTVLNITQGYYAGGKIELERLPDDKSNSPGSKYIKIGDRVEGYFGVVPANQLINGSGLMHETGVTQGTMQYTDTPWHKFAWEGKILFIAQQTIRHSISWSYLRGKGVVFGDKIIEIKGVKYKLRLIKGALTDPSKYSDSDRGAKGSEWNRLVAPLSVKRKDSSWRYPAYMESDLQDWKTYLSDTELTVRGSNGDTTWCQEAGGNSAARRVSRGYQGVSYSDTTTAEDSGSRHGWRPVLELVQ